MSVGLPRFTVTARQRFQVAVAAQGRPAVASVTVRGSQGIPGPVGPQGVPGGFGTIDYSDNDAVVLDANGAMIGGTAIDLPAGQWVRIIRNLTPSAANYNLPHGPFAGFQFWSNDTGLLHARKRGDSYLFKFAYTVIPAQIDGGLRFAVRPGDNPAFDFGPEPIVLTSDAGVAQTGSETFSEQARPRFVDIGAYIYMMATKGGTLTEFSPEITPIDAAP